MKWCQEPRCSPRERPACRRTFGVASRVPIPFRTSRQNLGLPLRRCSGQGPHLAKTLEPCGFSRVAAGFYLCLPCYHSWWSSTSPPILTQPCPSLSFTGDGSPHCLPGSPAAWLQRATFQNFVTGSISLLSVSVWSRYVLLHNKQPQTSAA